MTDQEKLNEIHAVLTESGFVKNEVHARTLLERSVSIMVRVQTITSLPSSFRFEVNNLLSEIGEYLK
jgi:hypothetical protein